MKPRILRTFAGLIATVTAAAAAFAPGDTAFTKRVETALLKEPRMTAAATARLPYARELKVTEVSGAWVRVKAGRASGWVFSGNLAAGKPSETRGLDGLPLAAAETTASAAARPLAPAAIEYAERKGLADAAHQLDWLQAQADAVTAEDVEAFLKEQRKGEYQ